MLLLNLILIAAFIVIAIAARVYFSANRAKREAAKRHEATKVVFFRDDTDVSWEWTEMPYIGSN